MLFTNLLLVACSDLVINKYRRLRLLVNQVSVVLIVRADACMQGVQSSNPTDDLKVVRRSTAFFAVEFNLTLEGT